MLPENSAKFIQFSYLLLFCIAMRKRYRKRYPFGIKMTLLIDRRIYAVLGYSIFLCISLENWELGFCLILLEFWLLSAVVPNAFRKHFHCIHSKFLMHSYISLPVMTRFSSLPIVTDIVNVHNGL